MVRWDSFISIFQPDELLWNFRSSTKLDIFGSKPLISTKLKAGLTLVSNKCFVLFHLTFNGGIGLLLFHVCLIILKDNSRERTAPMMSAAPLMLSSSVMMMRWSGRPELNSRRDSS